MKKNTLLFGISMLLTLNLFALNSFNDNLKSTGTKPVDEGQKNLPKKDHIKGSDDINNSYIYETKSLEKMKSNFMIRRDKISHSPFTLLRYDSKNKNFITISIEKNSLNSINFNVQKSNLNIGDRILVINDKDSIQENSPKGKEVIIEIEIIK